MRLDVSDDALVVSVVDEGHGMSGGARLGTGMRSMRERADELGGSCEIVAAPGGGTSVRASAPAPGAVVSSPIAVLVVDDHVFYREGVKALLATRPEEIAVVGEAATGEEALAAGGIAADPTSC